MHVYGNQVVRMINNRLHDEGLERSQILNSLKARPSLDGMRRASRSGAGAALWQQELFDGERCEPAVVAN